MRAARGDANLSQEKVAKRAEVHRTEIGLLERGGRVPRIDTVIKIGVAIGIDPCQLIKGITWRPGSKTKGTFALEEDSK